MLHVLLTLGQPHYLVYVIHTGSHFDSSFEPRNVSRNVIFCQPNSYNLCRRIMNWRYIYTIKFRKIASGLIFFKGPFWGAYFWRGVCMEGNLCFKIDWASLILGRKFTVFLCFALYLMAISKYIWRGDLTEGFLLYEFGLGAGAYIWRGLYMDRLIFGILRYFCTYECNSWNLITSGSPLTSKWWHPFSTAAFTTCSPKNRYWRTKLHIFWLLLYKGT